MLLEIKDEGRNELDSMIIEYHQSTFGVELKEEEIKIVDELEIEKIVYASCAVVSYHVILS